MELNLFALTITKRVNILNPNRFWNILNDFNQAVQRHLIKEVNNEIKVRSNLGCLSFILAINLAITVIFAIIFVIIFDVEIASIGDELEDSGIN